MNTLAQMKQARDNIAMALLNATANPRPKYNIEGQEVEFVPYIQMLLDAMTAINTLILTFEPYELKSVMS